MVFEDVMLFLVLVCDNVLFGCFELVVGGVEVDVVLVEVFEIVQVDFVSLLFEGVEICVGEEGFSFLGGQWQWFVFVWVIVVCFVVLVFDDLFLVLDVDIEVCVEVGL